MIKKIYIFGLIVTFLFSTTGFSVTQHICKMMSEVTVEECKMCTETKISETMPCCEDDNFAGEIISSGKVEGCCNTSIVNNKLEDEFIYLIVEVKNDLTSSIVELPFGVLINDYQIVKSHSLYAFDSSPPLRGNDIYIYNSVLLI